eukprot:SAG11_NODE_27405_length_333_cov_0.662393_1_plen_23_part_01
MMHVKNTLVYAFFGGDPTVAWYC